MYKLAMAMYCQHQNNLPDLPTQGRKIVFQL